MKYKTFRNLLLIGAAVLAGTGLYFAVRRVGGPDAPPESSPAPSPTPAPTPTVPVETSDPPATPTPTPESPPPGVGQPMRDVDRALVDAIPRLRGGKGKDVVPDAPYKINLYQDDGASVPNRAKIDLDRDDKWDEKWTFKQGVIVRQVAPADDEKYTEEYRLVDDRWLTAAELAAPAPTAEEPPDDPTQRAEQEGLRSVDRAVLALADKPLAGGKGKDILDGAIKVNLYQDEGASVPNRAKLDLDRDDKWDEKWTFEGEGAAREVKRQIAPADDEKYTLEFRLRGGKWVRK